MALNNSLAILDTFRISQTANPLISYHIQRTHEALQLCNVSVAYSQVDQWYQSLMQESPVEDRKCRLTFPVQNPSHFEKQILPIESLPPVLKVALAENHNQVGKQGLPNYKTNQRHYWNENKNSKVHDIIGINLRHQVTETSRFNLFLLDQEICYTPTLNSGCINGCLRRYFIQQKRIPIEGRIYPLVEKDFIFEQLPRFKIYLGNSLRGLLKAELLK